MSTCLQFARVSMTQCHGRGFDVIEKHKTKEQGKKKRRRRGEGGGLRGRWQWPLSTGREGCRSFGQREEEKHAIGGASSEETLSGSVELR